MINKILFTIFVIVAIWKGFSMLSRLSKSTGGVPRPGGTNERQGAARPADQKAVEMRPCPRCGAYIDPRERCSCSATGA